MLSHIKSSNFLISSKALSVPNHSNRANDIINSCCPAVAVCGCALSVAFHVKPEYIQVHFLGTLYSNINLSKTLLTSVLYCQAQS